MRKPTGKGVITIAFDDAYLDTYRYAIKYLDKLKIKSTIAVPALYVGKRFENRPVAGVKELKNIIKSGHEVASHTLGHPNLFRLAAKDKKAVATELGGSKTKLGRLLNYRVDSFVFPYINKNQTKSLRLKTSLYYKSARITSNTPSFNKIPLKDPYAVGGFAIMKKHSLPFLEKLVDYARKENLWLIEVFHLVGKKNTRSAHRPKPYRFFTHIDDFKKHIDYIMSKGITVLTQKDAVKKLT
ncbi:MAG: polysaccharide deacetylase family protein [Candidatus Omnitrophica bacterium]|nr:polysaccharide deacetylase family protein [Candidatus Omnitrophota bacterium]